MMPWAAAVAARAAAARAAAEAAAEAAVLAADAWAAWSEADARAEAAWAAWVEANALADALADAWAAWAAEANAWSEVDAEVFAWGAWVDANARAFAAESTTHVSANLGVIMTTHLPPDPALVAIVRAAYALVSADPSHLSESANALRRAVLDGFPVSEEPVETARAAREAVD